MRYAAGIVQHPMTEKWQAWVYLEDDTEATLTMVRSYRQHAHAHLMAHLIEQSLQKTGSYVDVLSLASAEQDVPDPLPQVDQQQLLEQIQASFPQP